MVQEQNNGLRSQKPSEALKVATPAKENSTIPLRLSNLMLRLFIPSRTPRIEKLYVYVLEQEMTVALKLSELCIQNPQSSTNNQLLIIQIEYCAKTYTVCLIFKHVAPCLQSRRLPRCSKRDLDPPITISSRSELLAHLLQPIVRLLHRALYPIILQFVARLCTSKDNSISKELLQLFQTRGRNLRQSKRREQ